MRLRLSGVALLLLGTVLAGGWLANRPRSLADISRRSSITTFSTADIGRQGHIHCGCHYVDKREMESIERSMYVECCVPKNLRNQSPVVVIHGASGSGAH